MRKIETRNLSFPWEKNDRDIWDIIRKTGLESLIITWSIENKRKEQVIYLKNLCEWIFCINKGLRVTHGSELLNEACDMNMSGVREKCWLGRHGWHIGWLLTVRG